MESQPQNPEFTNNPENFHPQKLQTVAARKKAIQIVPMPVMRKQVAQPGFLLAATIYKCRLFVCIDALCPSQQFSAISG